VRDTRSGEEKEGKDGRGENWGFISQRSEGRSKIEPSASNYRAALSPRELRKQSKRERV
jgi:hypothetical protein